MASNYGYILMENKFPSCIKELHHEENNIFTVGYIGSQHNKASLTCLEVPLASIILISDNIIDG